MCSRLRKTEAVHIRLSQTRDAQSLSQCVSEVASEGRWLGASTGFDVADTRSFIDEVHQHGGTQFVALVEEQIIGWCDVFRLQPKGMGHVGRLGMGILANRRGQGIGKRLLLACLAQSDSGEIKRIELEVFPDNPAAIALYEQSGFIREGYKRQAWCVGGRMLDVIVYARIRS